MTCCAFTPDSQIRNSKVSNANAQDYAFDLGVELKAMEDESDQGNGDLNFSLLNEALTSSSTKRRCGELTDLCHRLSHSSMS